MQNVIKQHRFLAIFACVMFMMMGSFPSLWSIFQQSAADLYGISLTESATLLSMCTAFYGIFYIIGGLMARKLKPSTIARIGGLMMAIAIFDLSVLGNGTGIFKLYMMFSMPFGGGCGIASASYMPVMMSWYADKRGFATGTMSATVSILLMGITYVTKFLLNHFGLAGTMRIISVFALILLQAIAFLQVQPDRKYIEEKSAIAIANTISSRKSSSSVTGQIDFAPGEMLRTPQYWFFFLSNMLALPAYQLVAASIVTLAISRGVSESLAVSMVAISLGVSAISKFIVPTLSDKIGRKKMLVFFLFCVFVSSVFVRFGHGLVLFIAYNMLVFAYGGWGSLYTPFYYDMFGFKYAAQNSGLISIYSTIGSFLTPVIVATLTPLLATLTTPVICITGSGLSTLFAAMIDPDTSKIKAKLTEKSEI